jgi:hypothetical protein
MKIRTTNQNKPPVQPSSSLSVSPSHHAPCRAVNHTRSLEQIGALHASPLLQLQHSWTVSTPHSSNSPSTPPLQCIAMLNWISTPFQHFHCTWSKKQITHLLIDTQIQKQTDQAYTNTHTNPKKIIIFSTQIQIIYVIHLHQKFISCFIHLDWNKKFIIFSTQIQIIY